jgi:hypothetical protein
MVDRVIRCVAISESYDIPILKLHIQLHLDYTDHWIFVETQSNLKTNQPQSLIAKQTVQSIVPPAYWSRFTYVCEPEVLSVLPKDRRVLLLLESFKPPIRNLCVCSNDIIVLSSVIEICEPEAILSWMYEIDTKRPLCVTHEFYQWSVRYRLGRREGARVFRAEMLRNHTITEIYTHNAPCTVNSGWSCLDIGRSNEKPYGAEVLEQANQTLQYLIKIISEPLATASVNTR